MWVRPVGEGAKRVRAGELMPSSEVDDFVAERDALDQSDGKQIGSQGRPTIAEEGQRDAGDREQMEIHADVEGGGEQDDRGDTVRDQGAERVASVARRPQTADQHETKQQEKR